MTLHYTLHAIHSYRLEVHRERHDMSCHDMTLRYITRYTTSTVTVSKSVVNAPIGEPPPAVLVTPNATLASRAPCTHGDDVAQ